MPLVTFFPLLIDSLLGLSFMHKNNIVHRDIKPQNILKQKNQFVINDYGEGVNLNDIEKGEEVMYSFGEYDLAGTPHFMDPILYQSYLTFLQNKRIKPRAIADLFKTDIYSMGLSLLNAATGKSVGRINTDKNMFQYCYSAVHRLALPIQIKQLILHMIQFDPKDRIPTVSLFNALSDMISQFKNGAQISFF